MIDSKKSIFAWSLYDWANSAFSTTVMAGFFPVFFKEYWSTTDSVTLSTWYLGLANSLASIIVAALAPFLGAIADRASAKKKFLMLFAFLGIIGTGSLWMVKQGQWQLAVIFYIIASIGHMSGNIFYDSLLPSIASKEKIDYTSSLGFALGYIGGGLLFLLNVLMYLNPSMFGIIDAATAIRLSFISVAIWWFIFSIPIMVFVKEPENYSPLSISNSISAGWHQLLKTVKEISHLKVVATFLVAYWLYIDGVDTIIRMAVDYGTSIGFTTSSLITALLLVQFVAFPATLGFNWYASKIGIKKAIYTAIIGYSTITLFAALVKEEWHFYILAILIACFQGGIQSLSRSMYARIIPIKKAAQFYGFYNMLGKFASIIGPPLMGYVGLVTGNPRLGILSIIILFISGGFILRKVDLDEGEKIAKSYLSKD
ncbi:MAG: MFS transporter [Candidatus Marinimicrobia bacterium]|jgi:UMF1 family MFS transporter|nr:MFS transporter [Candidatus Neomarinimicrobiota bacterium]MBT3796701.1 MFS transporter [Candidatus Neomarinimicrobiota bacterium]MBT4148982.1 MFS transporter [Candidatus Neomarinimicrobiota bacterium]MBT4784903.1 MFS transporter [Candidatus Neomarinimicrobiota bacterium]MBT5097128.1 MFS transporter [Candidatus Neomarinimicrobiota bacterium]|tara:strand:- start:5997 stop:7277 length:1281 start_codon:yes stop_codon:yes gene_type:complete